jgi:hypothetical protein
MRQKRWLYFCAVPLVAGWIAGDTVAESKNQGHNTDFRTGVTAGKDLEIRIVSPVFVGGGVQMPVLKWQYAGCYSSWCETGWYSSPAVADLDGNGSKEVIASAYSVVALEGATGELLWRVASGHDRSEPPYPDTPNVGRTWPGTVVADVDGDDKPEIVTAHGGGWVSVYNENGYFEPGWPKQPANRELRGLLVEDLDADGTLEIVVNEAENYQNTWVYEHTGALRPGWPRLKQNDSGGYGWGVYNDNAAAGDLDGDGWSEIVVPSDVHYICAYEPDASHVPAHPMYDGKTWGLVGVWESLDIELRGWGYCNGVRSESFRTNFASGPAVLADVDGNGSPEVVVTGNTYDCSKDPYLSKYTGVFIFNPDRSRFQAGSFDWRTVPVDTGAPIAEDWHVIESAQPNPAVADLDGDGRQEIVFPSYDGRMHAFWLDKTEHGKWPYSVYESAEGFYRFASEPVVADLDNNGTAEVIFTSWGQKGSNAAGKLHILDYLGNPLFEPSLPVAYGSPDWSGGLAAPTLADIDDDPDLEVVLNTAHAGFVAYDLPGTADARVLWRTGRGNFRRNGSLLGRDIFIDGFESGTTSSWSREMP